MYHLLLLLLVTSFSAVIGYTLLLNQQDKKGGFCVTDDDHRTVVFIPDISREPTLISAANNSQQLWTSEWQFENLYEKSKYWSADRIWHDLSQISTHAGDGLRQPFNVDLSKNIFPQQIYLSVLGRSVEFNFKFICAVNSNPYYAEINYCMYVDAYDKANKTKWLRLKSCTCQDVCISKGFAAHDFLENGTSWVHLEFNVFKSAALQINVKKRGQGLYRFLLDNTNNCRSIRLISASFESNEGTAFFKLHQGNIMSPVMHNKFAVIKRSIELQGGKKLCLDIAWRDTLPSELNLEIKTQYMTMSRSYIPPSFEFDWKTRLIEYVPYNGTYFISLQFKSYGGVSDVSFCSNKKDAFQIIHTNDYLKGCQLLAKAGQNEPNVIESNCSKSYSSTPAAFPFVLPAICSTIELEHNQDGFCDNYKVCDHLQCICIYKEASTISPSTANTEPQLSTSLPESADQNCTQDLSKNSSYIGTTSNEAHCPWAQQLLTLLMVVLSFLCVVIVILTVMAVQSYRSLKELEAAEDCTPQNNFELQPIAGSSTNTVFPNPH